MVPESPPSALDPRCVRAVQGQSVWVSGARGFIGSRLVHALRLHGARVTEFEGDVRQPSEVEASISDCDPTLLYNLAAPVDVSRDEALNELMEATLLGGARSVFSAAELLGHEAVLVQVGTCEEYGSIEAPFAEDDEPSAPVSPYSRFKLAATREVLRRAAASERVQAVVARPFLTYGPGQRSAALVPAAIRAALEQRPFPMTAGLQTRELNFVDDTAMGLLRVAAAPELRGSIVNIGCGDERRVVDIARLVFQLAGAPEGLLQPGVLPERSGEVRRFFADVRRCREVLRHEPRVGLEEGLARTIEAGRRSTTRSRTKEART